MWFQLNFYKYKQYNQKHATAKRIKYKEMQFQMAKSQTNNLSEFIDGHN